jgi:phenylalanyl-tRNA synthetase beta chain
MKISLDWLKQYIDLGESPELIRRDLSMLGLVVEGISVAGDDTVLEVEVTSNRPDCLSHLGIARELSALYSRPIRRPPVKTSLKAHAERVPFSIEIRDAALCPRYVGLVMDNVAVGPSPGWMSRRLEAAGMRSLNNIVDITNYVLLELGHPLHAFDFSLLRGGKIIVDRAADGQTMKTLDGLERVLDSGMLLINDAEGPVALGGVMGGLESEISDSTRTVLLECAYFDPISIRRTSKKLGLSTEASYRFERGADWGDAAFVISRTAKLIGEIAGGRIAGSVQDVWGRQIEPLRIELSRARAERLLGVELDDECVTSTLKRLEFKPVRKGKGCWTVVCPSYRADMELEADLVEELARFHGYDKIPTTLPAARGAGIPNPVRASETAVRCAMFGLGYSEAVNLSFASGSAEQEFPVPGVRRAPIRNPLTEETGFLRTSLAQGLVLSALRNLNRDVDEVLLFELGRVYSLDGEGRPKERDALGILGTGNFAGRNWLNPADNYGFYHLKGAVEAVLGALRVPEWRVEPEDGIPWLDQSDAARIVVGGERRGWLGSLDPKLQEEYKLRRRIHLAQVDIAALGEWLGRPVKNTPIPRFPAVQRDLSVLVDRTVPYAGMVSGIRSLACGELQDVELIDVYEGDKLPAGRLSMTLRLTFLDRERTLTVDRVQVFSDSIVQYLREHFGAELR